MTALSNAALMHRTAGCFSIRFTSIPSGCRVFRALGWRSIANNSTVPATAELIDYTAVAELKFAALRHAFSIFEAKMRPHESEFEAFRQERGELLQRFACFEVLRRQFGPLPWWQWPEEWRRPDDARIQAFRNGPLRAEVEFVEFVQWCAAAQLQSCADLAAERGMAVGLYLDVAVGVQAGGFDAWNEQNAISRGLSVGAPPDQLNTAGQDWGLAGFNAAGLEASGFAPFREMLRASMRFAGAIRLDHVLGLNRLYLIPSGCIAAGWRVCGDAIGGAARRHRAGERQSELHHDRGRSWNGAGWLSRHPRRMGRVVLQGDDVRTRP